MKESFRWYGPDDPVSLNNISQIGAKNVVSALHQIPNGLVWNKDDIKESGVWVSKIDLEKQHSLDEALDIIDKLKPKRSYLTQIAPDMGLHSETQKELPNNVFLAYDMLEVSF